MDYIFIGGTYRGFKVLERLVELGYPPDHAFILKEDEHETIKYADKIAEFAVDNNIPHSIRRKLFAADNELVRSKTRDMAVVCGWRSIISEELKDYFRLGMIAAHDSLLPKYRGFAPLNWAMINGEKEIGVTLFIINEGEVDSGSILEQLTVSVEENDYAIDVFEKITTATVKGFEMIFQNYQEKKIIPRVQKEEEATYTCKRTPDDGKICWDKDAKQVLDLIRGIAPPYPGAFCIYNSKKYIIHRASFGDNSNKNFVGSIPGRVLKTGELGIEVLCHRGTVIISKWEEEGSGQVQSPSELIKSITATLR